MTTYIETTTDARLSESNTVMLLAIAELHARCTRQQEQIETLRTALEIAENAIAKTAGLERAWSAVRAARKATKERNHG